MPFIPLSLPPGIWRNGTQYQSKGRWHGGNLVRFFEGAIMPHGGWRKQSLTAVTGKGRAIISWHDNAQSTWSAIGTESHLYVMTRGGVISDITPVGFTGGGLADALAEGGYGDGLYGENVYGAPIPDLNAVQDASMWTLDNFGQDLVGCMADESGSGTIYQWSPATPGTAAAAVSGAPSAAAIFTTAEGMLMALGANAVPRRLMWSDQQDNNVWTAGASNQAGDFELATNGRLLSGLRIKSGSLLFTDIDVWLSTYLANELVYGFTRVGLGSGAISRGSAVAVDAISSAFGAQAVWMGDNGFWLYNGYVVPLNCDVWDHVFGDLNSLQKSKITVEMNAAFGEITWHYPSGSSTEVDSYVTWNFRENHWSVGQVGRLSGVDAGINAQYPLRVAADGHVYEHEVGFDYGGQMPYLESGPFELAQGDQVQYARTLLPDDLTAGDVTATFFAKFAPDEGETSFGPYTLSKRTDLRLAGRQIRVRYDGAAMAPWRIGAPRLDVVAGGLR